MRSFVITYSTRRGDYSIHASGCKVACAARRNHVLVDTAGTFQTVNEAMHWCDTDESDKTGKSALAKVSVCKCTTVRESGSLDK